MNAYSPTGAWHRAALALAGGITGLSVLASSALLFSDRQDRRWIATAMGVAAPEPACFGTAATLPACGLQPARVAQAPMAAASGAGDWQALVP